jgi:hypothetical protein
VPQEQRLVENKSRQSSLRACAVFFLPFFSQRLYTLFAQTSLFMFLTAAHHRMFPGRPSYLHFVNDALKADDAAALGCVTRQHSRKEARVVLLRAVKNRAFKCIDVLLARNVCSINAFVSPWAWPFRCNALTLALHRDDAKMARWLWTRHKARWGDPTDELSWNRPVAILRATIRMDCPASVLFVLEQKADPNYVQPAYRSPLMLAAISEQGTASLVLLLRAKADVNVQPHSLLRDALQSHGAVAMLVCAKIDVNATSRTGDTAMDTLLCDSSCCKPCTVPGILKQLLEAKADPHTFNSPFLQRRTDLDEETLGAVVLLLQKNGC